MRLLTIDIETREIPGYSGYRSTRDGKVFGPRGHQLSEWMNPCGYATVKTSHRHIAVHRAVALAWIENPRDASDVNHLDGNKANNSADNLEWCSRSENIRHSLDTGLHACPETPVLGVNEKTGAGVWARSQAAAARLGFHQSLICKCLKGERRHHRGYTWSYAA